METFSHFVSHFLKAWPSLLSSSCKKFSFFIKKDVYVYAEVSKCKFLRSKSEILNKSNPKYNTRTFVRVLRNSHMLGTENPVWGKLTLSLTIQKKKSLQSCFCRYHYGNAKQEAILLPFPTLTSLVGVRSISFSL